MAAINYCTTFKNDSLADHFYAIAKHLASEINRVKVNGETRICFRICVGGCDTGMLRNLAVRTCDGTFCDI